MRMTGCTEVFWRKEANEESKGMGEFQRMRICHCQSLATREIPVVIETCLRSSLASWIFRLYCLHYYCVEKHHIRQILLWLAVRSRRRFMYFINRCCIGYSSKKKNHNHTETNYLINWKTPCPSTWNKGQFQNKVKSISKLIQGKENELDCCDSYLFHSVLIVSPVSPSLSLEEMENSQNLLLKAPSFISKNWLLRACYPFWRILLHTCYHNKLHLP